MIKESKCIIHCDVSYCCRNLVMHRQRLTTYSGTNNYSIIPKIKVSFKTDKCYTLLTSKVKVLSVVISAKVNMLHNVSFGLVSVLARPILRSFQNCHTRVSKMRRERGL